VIDGKVIWQYRPEDEVFDDASVESLLDAVITIGHPEGDDSDLNVIHGSVYDVRRDNESLALESDFLVVTEASNWLAKSGSPLSPMYDADVIEQSGLYKDQPFDWVQRNIRYSSVGLVDRARQGDAVRVFYQLSRDSETVKTESGIEYNASVITGQLNMRKTINLKDAVSTLVEPVAAPAVDDVVVPSVVPSTETLSAETLSVDSLTETLSVDSSTETLSVDSLTETLSVDSLTETLSVDSSTETLSVDSSTETLSVDSSTETLSVDSSTETLSVDPSTETDESEDVFVIAQITNEGGVLVDHDYVNTVVAVAEVAVDMGLMSLSDAIYYGQANLESVQKLILEHAGIALLGTDDVATAYKVFLHSRKQTVVETTIETHESPRLTIGDQDATNIKTIAAPIAKSKGVQNVQKPLVTHPITARQPVADAADTPAVVTFDSIGL
jgi:hypothetical protein